MKNLLSIIVISLFVIACKKDDENIIEGHYLADQWTNGQPYPSYPINNLTIWMQITMRNNSTADVIIDAPENGLYSPGIGRRSVVAPVRKISSNGYELTLDEITSDSTKSWLQIFPNGRVQYFFTPPKHRNIDVAVTMKKID